MLDRLAVGLLLRLSRGPRRRRQRGAQSLEYIGLGAVVATAMGGAMEYAKAHGADLGHVLLKPLEDMLAGGGK
jgi:hypothetical protein